MGRDHNWGLWQEFQGGVWNLYVNSRWYLKERSSLLPLRTRSEVCISELSHNLNWDFGRSFTEAVLEEEAAAAILHKPDCGPAVMADDTGPTVAMAAASMPCLTRVCLTVFWIRDSFCPHPLSTLKSSDLWAVFTWPLHSPQMKQGRCWYLHWEKKAQEDEVTCLKPKASKWYIQDGGLHFYTTFLHHAMWQDDRSPLVFGTRDVLKGLSWSWQQSPEEKAH